MKLFKKKSDRPILLLVLGAIVLCLSSCSWFMGNFFKEDPDQILEARGDVTEFAIVFTGNVNGETHPCGCRSFPLGGLPQVAGALARERAKHPTLFLDAGDTLFPQANLPESVIRSHIYTAETLALAMDQLGLNYWLPGDQDFAQGIPFFKKQITGKKYQILTANFNPSIELPFRKIAKIKVADQWIFLTGLIDPQLYSSELRAHIDSPQLALESVIKEMKEAGYNPKTDYFIVLSHLGIDADRLLAQQFPQIDWILGAHTQTFTNTPYEEGQTKLVQVLAKNHYLGKVIFKLGAKSPGDFSLIEVRDELKDVLNPNPMSAFLDEFKSKVDKIRAEEAASFTQVPGDQNQSTQGIRTYRDCLGCHQTQHDFWTGTAHALALTTLWKAKEGNNSECIGCHVLGWKRPGGMSAPDQFTVHDNGNKTITTEYLKQVHQAFNSGPNLKAMAPAERKKHFGQWQKLDDKYKVTANFASVQCLHCHQLASNHPFNPETGIQEQTKASLNERFQSQCVKCHTPDRSPEWYAHGEISKMSDLKTELVAKKIKSVACPK